MTSGAAPREVGKRGPVFPLRLVNGLRSLADPRPLPLADPQPIKGSDVAIPASFCGCRQHCIPQLDVLELSGGTGVDAMVVCGFGNEQLATWPSDASQLGPAGLIGGPQHHCASLP